MDRPTDGAAMLARLSSYRTAAQRIRRDSAPLGVKLSRLIALMEKARQEPDAHTRDLAERIIYAQAAWLLEGAAALARGRGGDAVERAARRLRGQGLDRCPKCLQQLSEPATWAFWSALREVDLRRLEALDREGGDAA
jgi:hypothetical protein